MSAEREAETTPDDDEGQDLVTVSIPTQVTKNKKRKPMRTEFETDVSAVDAQKREKERLERLEKSKQTDPSNHISQMEALLMNSATQQALPELDLQEEDFNFDSKDELRSMYFAQKSYPMPYVPNYDQPSTSKVDAHEVIDVSSDSDDDVTMTGYVKRRSDYIPRQRLSLVTHTKDEEDLMQMEQQVSKEKERQKKMRDQKTLESTEKHMGRLLVNSGHAESEPDVFVAPHLTHTLQPHQLGGIRFMYDNCIESIEEYKTSPGFGCILAHSMGLGKTIQVITFSEIFLRITKAKKVLVIVPINTIQNWYSEYNRWMPRMSDTGEIVRNFEVFIMGDAAKTFEQRVNVIEKWEKTGGVLLLGYDMFRLLLKKTMPKKAKKKRLRLNVYEGAADQGAVEDETNENELSEFTTDGRVKTEAFDLIKRALLDPGPDLIACDEGHKIKNLTSEIAMALSNIKTTRRIVLTGYPLQNNLIEYYCMIDFVRPKYLGNKKTFIEQFDRPIKNGQTVDSTKSERRLAQQRTHVLVEMVKGFVQRRTHHLLKTILPESKEYVILLRKSNIQRLLYRNFVLYCKSEMKTTNSQTFNPLKAFAACSKIWNHPDILAIKLESLNLEDNKEAEEQKQLSQYLWNQPEIGASSSSSSLSNQNVFPNIAENVFQPQQGYFNGLNQNGVLNQQNPEPSKVSTPKGKKRGRPGKGVQRTPQANNDDDIDENDDVEKGGLFRYDWTNEVMTDYQKGLIENGFKLKIALEILDECTRIGEKILIFSQNLTVLSLIEDYLSKRHVEQSSGKGPRWEKNRTYLRLDGSTTGSEREKLINRFNSESGLSLFLISTRAGSLGINLVSANRCIIFDACWNPCHDAQAVCRIYRYGQQKRTYIYRLILDNSMEKAIFNRQVSKHGMQQRVVDDVNVNANITQKELETLLVYDEALDVIHDKWDTSDWKFEDELLEMVTEKLSHMISIKPFLHESLILENDLVLSDEEKKEAQLLFEREKRMNRYDSNDYGDTFGGGYNPGILGGMDSMGYSSGYNPGGMPMQGYQPHFTSNFNSLPLKSTPMPSQIEIRRHNAGGATMGSQMGNSFMNMQYPMRYPMGYPMNGGGGGSGYGVPQYALQPNNPMPPMNMNLPNYRINLPSSFDGARESRLPQVRAAGFFQDIVVDRDIQLPLLGDRTVAFMVKAGEAVTLVRPKNGNGTYLKLPTAAVLDAAGTVYEKHADWVMQNHKPIVDPDVIELD